MDSEIKKRLRRQEKSNRRWVLFWSLVFAALAIILCFLTLSETRTDIESEAVVMETKSITCESDDILYPFFSFDESNSKNLKIIITVAEDNVKAVSLRQILKYDSLEESAGSEAVNHGELNTQFGKDGLPNDAFDTSFSATSSELSFGIRSDYDKLNSGKKYFLLDNANDYDYNRIKQAYEELGLVCME